MSVRRSNVVEHPLPRLPRYVGICCREWVLAVGGRGKCGDCDQEPVFLRREDV